MIPVSQIVQLFAVLVPIEIAVIAAVVYVEFCRRVAVGKMDTVGAELRKLAFVLMVLTNIGMVLVMDFGSVPWYVTVAYTGLVCLPVVLGRIVLLTKPTDAWFQNDLRLEEA